jgi:hypothetical protein
VLLQMGKAQQYGRVTRTGRGGRGLAQPEPTAVAAAAKTADGSASALTHQFDMDDDLMFSEPILRSKQAANSTAQAQVLPGQGFML